MGRRPKTLTDDQKIQLEGLAAFLTKEQIADYFGIARNTLTAMMERDPSIAERFARGRARVIGEVAKGVIDRAKEGDQRSAEFYLERVGGWASQARQETKHTGSVEVTDARSALLARLTAGSASK